MAELFTILDDFKEELSIKLVGGMGLFGGDITEENTESTESGESTAEDFDAFINDF